MRKIAMFVLAGMLLLSACSAPMNDAVDAKDAWARTGMMGGNSAAYMMLVNGTTQDDELVGVSSNVADAVEIHLSQMGADNVMQMIKQESVQIPARKILELKPGSYHVMMIGLKQDLHVGDSIALTLHFRNYGDVILTVPVKDAADMGGAGMDGHNKP